MQSQIIRTSSGNQLAASNSIGAAKHERIDKELLLLRNLPNSYKLGQKKTNLGRVIYVSNFLRDLFVPVSTMANPPFLLA